MASSKEWYDNIFKNSMRRPGGGDEITESNPLDWQRLRVLKDGKLVPVMGEVHFGPPNALQMELLQEEAKKGNLFLYRLGEEFPQQLVGDTWYSTNPAIKDQKPQLQIPEPPKAPPPFTTTLDDELQARGLTRQLPYEQASDANVRARYAEAQEAVRSKEAAFLKEQQQYQRDLQQYEAQRTRLTQEYNAKVQEWEKTVGAYDKLNIGIKQAINNETSQRSVEILRNQEVQRAADMEARPLLDWYHNEFRNSMVRFSGAVDLSENDGMDWSRVRIWDGEKFARALPEGHRGTPDAESLKNLRDAAENGNLFMYQRGDKYPSKWTGRNWTSMDKSWIDQCRPAEVKDWKNLPEKPVNQAGEEPKLEDFTKNISSARAVINRILPFTFRGTRRAYQAARADYAQAKERYDNAMAEYNREMEVYNEKMADLQGDYNRRYGAYEYMLQNYDALTAKQKAAMETDVAERTEEIKRNKEAETRKAEDLLVTEQKVRNQLDGADKRMEIVGNRPQMGDFLNPAVPGQQSLGQNAYDMVAPRGYDLPPNSSITPQEASVIHIALAGSAQAAMNGGLSPLSANQYGQMLSGVLYGRPSETDWKYIAGSYDAAKGYIAEYEKGNPQPLADALSAGLRNLITVGRGQMDMTPEMAGLAKLTGRLLDVMDAQPQLLEKCSLNKEEMQFARGMVELGSIYDKALAAKMELTKLSTGATQLTGEQVSQNTANLFVGQATNNMFKNGGPERTQLVNSLGTGNGNKMEVVQTTIQNNPQINAFANDPLTLKETDLDKRMQNMARVFGATPLAKPKESVQLREQVRDQVREQLQQNTPEARAARKRAQELDTLERQQARYVLAQQDPRYEFASLHDPAVTQKLNELREARDVLEARENQQYEKLAFRKKDLEGNEVRNIQNTDGRIAADESVRKMDAAIKDSLKTEANREEYKDRKADDLIEVDDSVSNKRYELTDATVLKEAAERASVRALMQQENAARRQEGKRELPINDFTLGRRMNELREAQKQLTDGEAVPDLTSAKVVEQATMNREARAERLRGPIKEMLQAQEVYTKELGMEVPDGGRWTTVKVQGQNFEQALQNARPGLKKAGGTDPFYRSAEVQKRVEELQKAREALGTAGKNLPLNDNAVIKKSYEMNGINPAAFGIQDPATMTPEQQTEYNERLQAIDHLRTVEGVDVTVATRGDYRVNQGMADLKIMRSEYEALPGAEQGLPLNDPKIYAARIARQTCTAEERQMNYSVQDIANLSQQIAGKPKAEAEQIVQQFIRDPQAQMQQPQIDAVPQVQPMVQAPPGGGPP